MAVLAGASLQAADDTVSVYYEGRLLNAAGAVQTSRTSPRLRRSISRRTARKPTRRPNSRLRDRCGRPFRADGRQPPGAVRTGVFWLGVTPQGGDEIRPRMRVTPAPYAIAAVHAARVESDTLSGEGRVDVASATVRSPLSADSAASGRSRHGLGRVSGFKGYVVDSLSFGADAAFDASPREPSRQPDVSTGIRSRGQVAGRWTRRAGSSRPTTIRTARFKIAADDDGFAVVLCRAATVARATTASPTTRSACPSKTGTST